MRGRFCRVLLSPGLVVPASQSQKPAAAPADQEAANLSSDQLDSLVAPIALYPVPVARSSASRIHVPFGTRSTPAMAGEKQDLERQGTR